MTNSTEKPLIRNGRKMTLEQAITRAVIDGWQLRTIELLAKYGWPREAVFGREIFEITA